MQVARRIQDVSRNDNSIVTIGTFDGVHLGHRAILEEVVRRATAVEGRAVLLTFDPHPRLVVKHKRVPLLTTMEERIGLFRDAGIDVTVIVNFTHEFSKQSAETFYRDYIVGGIGVREVIVGHDHMFGRDRAAGAVTLRRMSEQFGFSATTVGPVHAGEEKISSSRIRDLLTSGKVEDAAGLLGRQYQITGTVTRGDGRGTGIGFPTANVVPSTADKLLPGHGVYFVRVEWQGTGRYGMMNIGVRPTFIDAGEPVAEVHLFDWNGQLEGKDLTVHFIRKIRNEKKFSSAEELSAQLERDRSDCLAHLSVVQEQ